MWDDDKLVLYRGDFSKIKDFEFAKTKKYCLYGQGIYLTNDPKIADTYRTKGADYTAKGIDGQLWYGEAKNKNEAKDMAFINFAFRHIKNGKMVLDANFAQERKKQIEKSKRYKTTSEKEIQAAFPKEMTAAKQFWYDIVDELEVEIKPNMAGENKTYNVVWPKLRKTIGHVTQFTFPKLQLQRNTLSVNIPIALLGVTEIVQEFCKTDVHRSNTLDWLLKSNVISTNSLRSIFEPWGYYGISHTGGIVTNGKRHKVYILWDENFVNQHRSGRM